MGRGGGEGEALSSFVARVRLSSSLPPRIDLDLQVFVPSEFSLVSIFLLFFLAVLYIFTGCDLSWEDKKGGSGFS